MKKSEIHQTKVSTNLEKKTRQKIASRAGAAGLNDFKMQGKFKKCHVRVAKLSKNTLGKISKKKDKPQNKKRATLIRGGVIKKKTNEPNLAKKFPAAQTSTKTENKQEQKQKANPNSNKRNKGKKKQQIFIRLPFSENSKMKSLNKDLVEKQSNKKAHPVKRLGKTHLTETFGSRFFRCHVRVARYRSPNDPTPKKKEKYNRKSVSFHETVEILGESDDDQSQPSISSRSSTPAQITCNSSNDSITVSPSKRKLSLLKNAESPRSEHMRRSDEKVPQLKSVDTESLAEEESTDNTYRETEEEEPPTVSSAEDCNEHKSLNEDETEHEILPEDERMDEEDEEDEDCEGVKTYEEGEEEENDEEGEEEKQYKKVEEEKQDEKVEEEKQDEEDEEEQQDEEDEEEQQDEDVEEEKQDEEDDEKRKRKCSDQTDEGNKKQKEFDEVVGTSADETDCYQIDDDDDDDDVRICEEGDQKKSNNDKVSIKKEDKDTEELSADQDVNTFETAPLDDVDKESTSHQPAEDDHEACSDQPGEQMESAGNNNNSSHIELSSNSDHYNNMFYDVSMGEAMEPEIFLDGDDPEKEFSLQMSNNSETSALCQKPEQTEPELEPVASNLDNIDSIFDDMSETSQTQQTKFSLNTFFKSLKTKIMSKGGESVSSTKSSNQCKEHEGDQTLRDELTIK